MLKSVSRNIHNSNYNRKTQSSRNWVVHSHNSLLCGKIRFAVSSVNHLLHFNVMRRRLYVLSNTRNGSVLETTHTYFHCHRHVRTLSTCAHIYLAQVLWCARWYWFSCVNWSGICNARQRQKGERVPIARQTVRIEKKHPKKSAFNWFKCALTFRAFRARSRMTRERNPFNGPSV